MTTGNDSIAARDVASLVHPYTNLKTHQGTGPLVIRKGRGIHVYDDAGKEYIEGLASLWCCALGFSIAVSFLDEYIRFATSYPPRSVG